MAQETERRLGELPPVGGGGPQLGLFVLKLQDILDAGRSTMPNNKGEYPMRTKWVWEVVEVLNADVPDPDELVGQKWFKWATLSMGKKSTMYNFAASILNRDLERDEVLRPESLIGGSVKMYISEKDGDTGKMVLWTATPYKAQRRTASPRPAPTPIDDVPDEVFDDEPVPAGRSSRAAADPFD